MRDREISKIASGIRRGILEKRPSDRMCLAVCLPLQGYLSACGLDTELVEGDFGHTNHYWLRLPDGRILDPTADQFSTPSRSMPKVYMGPLPEWYTVA
jgi:hypothetical protein